MSRKGRGEWEGDWEESGERRVDVGWREGGDVTGKRLDCVSLC